MARNLLRSLTTKTTSTPKHCKKGSVRNALEVEPPFHQYVFVERDPTRVAELRELLNDFPKHPAGVQIEQADANEFLQLWRRSTDWQRRRAVVFLDPYGMQVHWATVEAIAKTAAVDLWILFPLGVAVNRLLTKNELPPKEWADTLTRNLGTEEWKQAFYKKRRDATLFGEEEAEVKDADFDEIGGYFLKRLKTVFAAVAENPLVMRNSKGAPIYLLCFAAGNPKGASTAVKIAQHILR